MWCIVSYRIVRLPVGKMSSHDSTVLKDRLYYPYVQPTVVTVVSSGSTGTVLEATHTHDRNPKILKCFRRDLSHFHTGSTDLCIENLVKTVIERKDSDN
jgi:hypothetical protein